MYEGNNIYAFAPYAHFIDRTNSRLPRKINANAKTIR